VEWWVDAGRGGGGGGGVEGGVEGHPVQCVEEGILTSRDQPINRLRPPRLKQQPGVDPNRIAVAGFCYGGASALRYSSSHPGDVKAVGVFYGRPLESAEGYMGLAGVPVYGVFGDKDNQFSKEAVDALEVGCCVGWVGW
jgi:predicted esterase